MAKSNSRKPHTYDSTLTRLSGGCSYSQTKRASTTLMLRCKERCRCRSTKPCQNVVMLRKRRKLKITAKRTEMQLTRTETINKISKQNTGSQRKHVMGYLAYTATEQVNTADPQQCRKHAAVLCSLHIAV